MQGGGGVADCDSMSSADRRRELPLELLNLRTACDKV
jgi:hypothetical protein